jgi:MSHA biogenesis protein MshI
MKWFRRAEPQPGWLCINMMPDRIDVSHARVDRPVRPEVLLCESYRKDGIDDAAALKRLGRVLDLDRYRCTTLLKPGQYQMAQVEAPNVPDAELKSALRWRVKDVIDYAVEQATIDALRIPAAGGARGHQAFAVAARNDTIAATVAPFTRADIPLEAVDVPELAQRNVARWFETEGRALALLVFDEHGGLLTFTCGGELYQYRRIDVTAAALSDAEGEEREKIHERVALELQRSLDHFDRQFGQLAVSRVLVAPVPAASDLIAFLASNLGAAVAPLELGAALDCVQAPDLADPHRQQQCLQLIGAAMRT